MQSSDGGTGNISEAMRAIAERAKAEAARIQNDPEVAARVADLQRIEAENLAAYAKGQREKKWEHAGIPRRLWAMLHGSVGPGEGPAPSAALTAAGSFLSPKERATVLVLAGGVGTGKTVAAAWACAFHGGRLVKAIDLVKAGLFSDDLTGLGLARVDLVAVDDMGMEPMDAKGYGYAALYDLLERRYDAGLKTIITTNLTQSEFRERYGSGPGVRLWDRIREDGMWFDVPGESMRRPA